MFKQWGWYLVVFLAAIFAAAMWSSAAHAALPGTSIAIHSTPGPVAPPPQRHQRPDHRDHHGHHHYHDRDRDDYHHRPRPPVYQQPAPVYVQPAPVYQQPPVYYVQPAPVRPPVRVIQECQRWDGWRQQYIYVPC